MYIGVRTSHYLKTMTPCGRSQRIQGPPGFKVDIYEVGYQNVHYSVHKLNEIQTSELNLVYKPLFK